MGCYALSEPLADMANLLQLFPDTRTLFTLVFSSYQVTRASERSLASKSWLLSGPFWATR